MKYLICLTYSIFLYVSFPVFGQSTIKFKTNQSTYFTGEEIRFQNLSPDPYADSLFTWEFGEDCGLSPVYDPLSCIVKTNGLENVTYTYHHTGKYEVSLRSANASYSKIIEIIPEEKPTLPWSAKESFDNNLVTNSGFESFINCPDKPGQLYNALSFYSPTPATPDYFNSCYTDKAVYNWKMDVPDNFAGKSAAKDGNAYTGIINYIAEDTTSVIKPNPASKYYNYREYIETKLNNPLEKGQTYAVQCYVKLSSKSRVSTNMGMLLSKTEVKFNQPTVLPGLQPQLSLPGITDTAWVLIADTFIADDGFEYLVIGNFNDDQSSKLKDIRPDSLLSSKYGNFNAFVSYSYIDAVTVSHIFNESQERFTIATAGSTFTGNDVQIDFTVGQRAFQTLETGSVICTQGFQQPDENDNAFHLLPSNSLILSSIQISAYPNPFNSYVQIQIVNKLQNDVSLELYDLFGKKQYSEIIHIRDENLFEFQLDLKKFPDGIYTLIISNYKDIGTYKLVKQ